MMVRFRSSDTHISRWLRLKSNLFREECQIICFHYLACKIQSTFCRYRSPCFSIFTNLYDQLFNITCTSPVVCSSIVVTRCVINLIKLIFSFQINLQPCCFAICIYTVFHLLACPECCFVSVQDLAFFTFTRTGNCNHAIFKCQFRKSFRFSQISHFIITVCDIVYCRRCHAIFCCDRSFLYLMESVLFIISRSFQCSVYIKF